MRRGTIPWELPPASAAGYYYTVDGLISQRIDPDDDLPYSTTPAASKQKG